MKYLIGLLFCIGFLLFAGTTDTQAQMAPTFASTYQVSCLDIGKPKISIGTPTVHKGFVVDIAKLRETSRLAAFIMNEAFIYRYVPACPVQHVGKGYDRYYHNSHLHYIKSPKWQSNFNI